MEGRSRELEGMKGRCRESAIVNRRKVGCRKVGRREGEGKGKEKGRRREGEGKEKGRRREGEVIAKKDGKRDRGKELFKNKNKGARDC